MDPRAQDVLLCDLCGTEPLLYCCEHCDLSLCTNCVSKHISTSNDKHNVVRYNLHKKFTSKSSKYSTCLKHADNDCEHYCEKCKFPICSTCLSSGKHKGHDLSDVLEKFSSEKRHLQQDLEGLEKQIYPWYEEMVSDFQTDKSKLETNYTELTTAVDQQGVTLHHEVTAIVNQRKSDITEAKNKHLAALKSHRDEITQRMIEIKQTIIEMKNIVDTNDISLTLAYRSRNEEFNKLPPKIKVKVPSLSTLQINKDRLNEMIGTLSSLSITTVTSMLAEPRFTATIDTGYDRFTLRSVSCLGDERVWTRGDNNIMRLLNLQGKLLSSIKTKSGNRPCDIAVTRNGDLGYTDFRNRTVNLVKNKRIRTVITLQGWGPCNVCSTASDDFLVTMISDDEIQSKVVRYVGSTETQTIQFDGQDRPLYSSGALKYISENRNLDICVADNDAKAIVVVDQSGELRFRYTGHTSNTDESFDQVGITTDSQGRILISDFDNYRIHILDQNGQFLRFIHNLNTPQGLCVDIRDNLLVAECGTVKVKEIQYQC